MLTRRRAFAVFVGAGLSLITACSGSSSPGTVEFTINAGDDINPDPGKRPSPVVLRIYQLTGGTQFQAADFFQLFDKETPTLGPDLAAREEVTVAPGKSLKITIQLKPNVQTIGVAAAFRDIDRASWRAAIDVPPTKTTKLKAEVHKLQVTLAKA